MNDIEKTISKTRFTSEDLFVLMGGLDGAWFVCKPNLTGPTDPSLKRKMDKWRRKTVNRHRAAGLVDSSCTPCDELARIVEAMRDPITTVEDGQSVEDPGAPDERRTCVYIGRNGTAVEARMAEGFFEGFFIRKLEDERAVLDAILGMHGLKGRMGVSGLPSEHRVIGGTGGYRWLNSALEGKPSETIAIAEKRGFDPTALLALGRWWEEEGARLRSQDAGIWAGKVVARTEGPLASMVYDKVLPRVPTCIDYCTSDFSGGVLLIGGESLIDGGISTGIYSTSVVHRFSRLFSPFGFMFSIERAPLPGDPPDWWGAFGEERDFGSYDVFASEDELSRRLLTVDDNPGDGVV